MGPDPSIGKSPSRAWEPIAVALALVGVGVRCLQWSHAFSGPGVVFVDVDTYYHLWRTELLASSFPVIPLFDPYLSYPAGAVVPWPPGFDLLLSLPVWLGGGIEAIAPWATVVGTLLGGVSVYLTYRLGRRIFDASVGLVAALFMAVTNGVVGLSIVGRPDHHALVAPVTLGFFLALLAALRSSGWRSWAWGVLCGVLAAVAVGSWIITPALYFLPVPLTLLCLGVSSSREMARHAAWKCLVPASLLVLVVVLLTADLTARPFVLYQPSWLSVALFALPAVFVLAVVHLGRRGLLWGAGLLVMTLLLALLITPAVFAPLVDALRVAAGLDPSYLMATESARVYFEGEMFTLDYAVAQFGYLALLTPIVPVLLVLRQIRARKATAETIFACLYLGLAIILLLIQVRFVEYSGPAVALCAAWILVAIVRNFLLMVRLAPGLLRLVVLGVPLFVLILVSLFPLAKSLVGAAQDDPFVLKRNLAVFARKLKENTPAPVGPDGRLLYGLLASWDNSHPLLYEARRPVLVSSFGTREALEGNRVGFRLLLTSDEEDAYRTMQSLGIRYVVVSLVYAQMQKMAVVAGLNEQYVAVQTSEQGDQFVRNYSFLRPFFLCLHTRMLLGDGTTRTVADHQQEPLAHLRLHLESDARIKMFELVFPEIKAFEAVEGARLQGAAPAGETVRLRLTIRTNTGREFTYAREAVGGADGTFTFVVPYWTGEVEAQVAHAIGPYRINVAGRVSLVEVTEEDVRAGRIVPVQ